MPNKLPTITELKALFVHLKKHIHDDYRAPDWCEGDDDETPTMQVTIGWCPETGVWDYQTGDNSYSGGAYLLPHWAVVYLTRRSNSLELARDVQRQLCELVSY